MCSVSLYVFGPQMINVIRAAGSVTRMVENFSSANFSMLAVCKLLVTWYHGKTLQSLIISIMTDWMTSTKEWERNTMLKITKSGRNLTKMAYGVYECKWYDLSSKDAKNLMFIVHRSRISLKLAAGKFGTFSLEMFGIVRYIYEKNIYSFIYIRDSKFRRPNIRFIIVTCTVSFYVSGPQIMNVIRAWGNLSRILENFVSATFSLMGVSKLIVTWYHGEKMLASVIYTCINIYTYINSTKMTYGVYECKWYDIPPKDAKDLMFIVHRSRIPLKLTIGKFGIFSLQMFGTVRYI
ncbi:hypothetical protein ALC57_12637 [Trachymyrmex cornetzi]|uniref:Uncharacterized protein n=1 Tax=Trachymyrmex cornetzi TaxID=471704 RepID=A0A195DQ98_9HYME|nr:hypothetical protein ALC57_12637 [Trachymyrmex cornetzi]